MAKRRASRRSKGLRPTIVTVIIASVVLVVGWAFLPRSVQEYLNTHWNRRTFGRAFGQLMTAGAGAHPIIRQEYALPLRPTPLPATPKLPRFALCLSGELRTFEATAPSYHAMILANQDVGIDIFGYIGFDPYPYLQQPYSNGSISAPDSNQRSSSEALAHVLAVTVNWPGSFVHEHSNASVTSVTGPVKQFVVEHEDPWSRLAAQLWSFSHRQIQRLCSKARVIVLQAHKVQQCQLLLEKHVHNHRAGQDYDLIIRSRFDLLLPEPPNLFRILSAAEQSQEGDSDVASSPSTSGTTSTAQRHFQGVLFVPFCCDWAGVNDQFAIGTPLAMRAYSRRLFHVKIRHGDENVHGDGCPHVGSELACQRAVEHNDLKIMRFWCDAWMNAIDSVNYPVPYEYTIVRPHHFAAVSARTSTVAIEASSGERHASVMFAHQMFYACHQMVSGSVVYYGFADLGTTCGQDPRVAFSSASGNSSVSPQSRLVRRQRRRGGRLHWTASDLKCAVLQPHTERNMEPREGSDRYGIGGNNGVMADTFVCEPDQSRHTAPHRTSSIDSHNNIGDAHNAEYMLTRSQIQDISTGIDSTDPSVHAPSPRSQPSSLPQQTSPVQPRLMRCFGRSQYPKDLPETNYTFWPDLSATADAVGADSPNSGCSHDDADDVTALRQHLLEMGFPPGNAPCVASQQLSVSPAPFGVGSVINSWLKPYMYAIAYGFIFWSPPLGLYRNQLAIAAADAPTNSKRCVRDSFSCWFEPLSRCENAPYLEGELPGCRSDAIVSGAEAADNEEGGRACVPNMGYRNSSLSQFSRKALASGSTEDLNSPIRALYDRRGHFWFTSQLLAHLMRPNSHFQRILHSSKIAAGFIHHDSTSSSPIHTNVKIGEAFQRPVLSLHVRHGDSCSARQMRNKKRTCDPLSVYMEQAVLPMAKKYGIKTIYFATDDSSLFAAADGIRAWPQFHWLHLPPPNAKLHGGYSDAKLKGGEIDGYEEAQNALIDILLLAEGDMFVGKFTSNVDRITLALLAARKHELVPYASLDSPWCSDWGINSGVSLYQNRTASFVC